MAATETAERELPAVSDTSQATPDRKHFTSKHKFLNAGSLRHPDFQCRLPLGCTPALNSAVCIRTCRLHHVPQIAA